MTALVCPHCDSSFVADKRMARGEVAECVNCHKKLVVSPMTLQSYQKSSEPAVEQTQPNTITLHCPHCRTEQEGDMTIGEIISCISCDKQFEVTPDRVYQEQIEQPVQEEKKQSWVQGLFTLIVGIFLFKTFVLGGGTTDSNSTNIPEPEPAVTVVDHQQNIAYRVAANKTEEYEIAKRNNDKMKTCVLAGHINVAYLKAKDEEMYQRWRGIERQRCREAGVPIKD